MIPVDVGLVRIKIVGRGKGGKGDAYLEVIGINAFANVCFLFFNANEYK